MMQNFTVFCFKHFIDIHRVETYADEYFHGPIPDLIFLDCEAETREVIPRATSLDRAFCSSVQRA